MKPTFRSLWLTVILLACAGAARATAPSQMTYQGRVKEAGLPVTGVRSIDIYLCPDAVISLGACIDTGVQSVQVTNGLFRTTFTALSSVPWESGVVFLQLQVNGQLFTPREMFASAPYAVYASSAATLIRNPSDASVKIADDVSLGGLFSVGGTTLAVVDGKVGVGTASPATALEVTGQVTLSGAAHVRASGAGGGLPVVGASSCGTGTIAGSDSVGRITIGLGVVSTLLNCQIVFGTQWTPNPPVCHFTSESGTAVAYGITSVDTFQVTFVGPGNFTTGEVINYQCLSY